MSGESVHCKSMPSSKYGKYVCVWGGGGGGGGRGGLVLFLFTAIRQWISVIVIENLQHATLTDDSRHLTGRVHSFRLLKGHCTEVQGASQDPSSGRQQQQKALMQNV